MCSSCIGPTVTDIFKIFIANIISEANLFLVDSKVIKEVEGSEEDSFRRSASEDRAFWRTNGIKGLEAINSPLLDDLQILAAQTFKLKILMHSVKLVSKQLWEEKDLCSIVNQICGYWEIFFGKLSKIFMQLAYPQRFARLY